jgi:hypothetical protein
MALLLPPALCSCVGHRVRDIIGGVRLETSDRGLEAKISGPQISIASIGLRHAAGAQTYHFSAVILRGAEDL